MRRPETGAGEHRDGQLGDHRHVDGDPVAGLHTERLEGVGRLLDLGQQVGVGDRPHVARFADPVVGDLVPEARLDVPVDAVVGHVELAADEPLGEREVPFEDLVERAIPAHVLLRLLGPERLGIGICSVVEARVGDPRLGFELGARRKRAALVEQRVDGPGVLAHPDLPTTANGKYLSRINRTSEAPWASSKSFKPFTTASGMTRKSVVGRPTSAPGGRYQRHIGVP